MKKTITIATLAIISIIASVDSVKAGECETMTQSTYTAASTIYTPQDFRNETVVYKPAEAAPTVVKCSAGCEQPKGFLDVILGWFRTLDSKIRSH